MVVGIRLDTEFYKVVPGAAIFEIGRDGPSKMRERTRNRDLSADTKHDIRVNAPRQIDGGDDRRFRYSGIGIESLLGQNVRIWNCYQHPLRGKKFCAAQSNMGPLLRKLRRLGGGRLSETARRPR